MSLSETIKRIYHIFVRELVIMWRHPIYGFCTIVFPVMVVLFFTTLMNGGQPVEMPVGVVDQDNTHVSRAMIRELDAFQTTTDKLLDGDQPKISFYYSNVTLVAGSLLYRDLKTIASLGSAAVGAAKLSALGKTTKEIRTFLQPVTIDLHQVGNPWSNYNVYLSTAMVPGVLMIFVFLLTPYSIGTELKFHRSKQWMRMADNNVHIAIAGKILPQTVIFTLVMWCFEFYIFYGLHFPHPGGVVPILLLGFLSVFACQCFGIFIFGLMPSLRMSMSICSLWSVVSFSACGATYPVFAMDSMIQSLAQLFPLRHYYMIYQMCIFNGYPLSYAWFDFLLLIVFAFLPMFTINNIKKAMLIYVYIP